ncbi:hypothetical protein U3516DRAFT_760468 [Neocallimastix sp. 'constans']
MELNYIIVNNDKGCYTSIIGLKVMIIELLFTFQKNFTSGIFMNLNFWLMSNLFMMKLEDLQLSSKFNSLLLMNGIKYKDINIHPISGFGRSFITVIFLSILCIVTIATSVISYYHFQYEKYWLLKKNTKHPILKIFTITILIDIICSVTQFFYGDKFEIQKGYWAFLGSGLVDIDIQHDFF